MVLFQQHSADTFLRSAVMVEIFNRKKLVCQLVTSGNRKKMNRLQRNGAAASFEKENFHALTAASRVALLYPFDFQYCLRKSRNPAGQPKQDSSPD
ncbi:MAG: hypothetical protein RIM72_20600 [Alphaproteobacteria bacterium]